MDDQRPLKGNITKLSLEQWRVAKRRVKAAQLLKGWTAMQDHPPAHNQWLLVCNDPQWGKYNPPVYIMLFVTISESEFVRKTFPKDCNREYLADSCSNFDGAFLTSDYQSCIVCDGPWFPDYWKALPDTPFDQKAEWSGRIVYESAKSVFSLLSSSS
jgi:hypothetical protein